MRMTREERVDLRRRIREGREHVRRRIREEIGRVDFKALRAQARAAQARAAGQELSPEQAEQARRRLAELKKGAS